MVGALFIERVWLEVSWEIILVIKLSVIAKEDLGAWLNHLWSKGKLLAVKYQGSLVLLNGFLHVVCSILDVVNSLKSVGDCIKVVQNVTQLDLDHLLMSLDVLSVDVNLSFN